MIDPADLKIEAYPPRPRGGQQVGFTPVGVKATHLPTGTEAVSMLARSQHANREVALDMILTALIHPKG